MMWFQGQWKEVPTPHFGYLQEVSPEGMTLRLST